MHFMGTPKYDCGTEKTYLQPALCRNDQSFRFGTSVSNQVYMCTYKLLVHVYRRCFLFVAEDQGIVALLHKW